MVGDSRDWMIKGYFLLYSGLNMGLRQTKSSLTTNSKVIGFQKRLTGQMNILEVMQKPQEKMY